MAIVKQTNISLAEVRDILNGAGGSVSNDLATFFSENAKLNMWSKYKPVVYPEPFVDDDRRWQGMDGKCGLTIPTYGSPAAFRAAAKAGNALWTYAPPKGGDTEPRRLGDFRGYCSDAYNPIGGVASNGIINSGEVTFAIDVALSGTSSTNLTLTDIGISGYNGDKLSEFYLGVFAWKGNGYIMRTASTKIGEDSSLTVSIPMTPGDWEYMPFLTSSVQGENEQAGTFLSVNKPAQKLTVKDSSNIKEAFAFGAWNSAYTKVTEISVFLSNDTSASVTFTNVRVWLVRSTGSAPDQGESVAGTTVNYSGSVVVAAKSTAWVNVADISHGKADGYHYWLACASGQSATKYQEIEEQQSEP